MQKLMSHNNIIFGKYENLFLFFKKPLNYVLLLDNISSFCVCRITHKSFNVHFAQFFSLISTTARFKPGLAYQIFLVVFNFFFNLPNDLLTLATVAKTFKKRDNSICYGKFTF
jgi:hypothetical protein